VSLAEYVTACGTPEQQTATLSFFKQVIQAGELSTNMRKAVHLALKALPETKEVKKLLSGLR
jgi:hypothetical protein